MSRGAPSLRRAVIAALAVTVVLFAFGSASVPALLDFGRPTRWIALFALCGLAFVQAGVVKPTWPGRFMILAGLLGAALVALALLSAAWSITPRLTLERGATLLVLLVTAWSLAYAVSADPDLWARLLEAILVGAAVVCLLGLVVLAVAPHDAVQWATPGTPARYRGLGQNPNTVPMLAAIAVPIALWVAVRSRTTFERGGSVAALALFFGTIATSNSRGALIAAVAALVALSLVAYRAWTLRLVPVAAAVVLVAVGAAAVKALPTAAYPTSSQLSGGSGGSGGKVSPSNLIPQPPFFPGPLYDELGRPRLSNPYGPGRDLVGSSGRGAAWEGAFHLGETRPVLGYGFGTEERVFVDRYYTFQGSRPENSFLGLFLQLGALGVLLLVALLVTLAAATVSVLRVRGERLPLAGACVGVIVAGFVLAGVQSYVYSVGNIASVSFWVAAFLLTVAATPPAEPVAEPFPRVVAETVGRGAR